MERPRFRWASALVLSLGLTLSVAAAAKLSRAGGASAGFRASGPAGMNIDGETREVTVTDDGSAVTIAVALSGVKTGIGLRDEHTKKALEADKYPSAEFKVARGELKIPAAGAETTGDAKGSMKIHGQSRTVVVHYKAKRDGDSIRVTGTARINMTDFGIKPPTYLGVGVKPDVDLNVSFEAKDG